MNSNPDAAAKERTFWWSGKEWKLRQRHRGSRIAWSTELKKSVFRKDVSTLSQNFGAGQQISAMKFIAAIATRNKDDRRHKIRSELQSTQGSIFDVRKPAPLTKKNRLTRSSPNKSVVPSSIAFIL
jgi:hypothetical protein